MPALVSISGCAPGVVCCDWRPLFVGLGLLLPTLALSGYVTAGNRVLRAAGNPNYAKLSLEESNLTDQKSAEIGQIARIGAAIYLP